MRLPLQLEALLSGKRALIFDFDGTLADTSPLHAAAFKEVLAPLGIAVDYASIAGLKTADAIGASLTASGLHLHDDEVSILANEKQRIVREMISQCLRPLPGVDEFLHWARGRHQLALVSSGSRGTVELSLRVLRLETLFDPIVCAEDVRSAKPHPAGFLLAVKKIGCAPSDALIFEDSNAGIDAASAAGIACWDVRQVPLSFAAHQDEVIP